MTAIDPRRHAIPNVLRFEESPSGLTRAIVTTEQADATIYLHGAHLTDWTPRGKRRVIFTSAASHYAADKPIRGGVPIVFPWFGPRGGGLTGPLHGFARISEWTLESAELMPAGEVDLTFVLGPSEDSRALGFSDFEVRFRASIGATLEMDLEVGNSGLEPLHFEEALHTYFAVGDIRGVSVGGLEGTTYVDKTDNFQRKQQAAEPIRIAKETDQVHVDTEATCYIDDAAWERRIVIEKAGSDTTVVWNPWIEKTRTLADMKPDDWQGMICVETANAMDNARVVLTGASHRMKEAVRVE
jgi:glucose-6-phosphate 1-epimerase